MPLPTHIRRIELHITELEARLEVLNSSFMSESSDHARKNIQRELFALQTALDHYRAALDLERTISADDQQSVTN